MNISTSNINQCFSGDGFQKVILAQCSNIKNRDLSLISISKKIFRSSELPFEQCPLPSQYTPLGLALLSMPVLMGAFLGFRLLNNRVVIPVANRIALMAHLALMVNLVSAFTQINSQINNRVRHPDFPGQSLNVASPLIRNACVALPLFPRT